MSERGGDSFGMATSRRDHGERVTGRRSSDVRRRVLAAVFMLLHAAAVGFVPLADAALERDADYTVHIESGDRPACPQHDHLQCQLCRVAGANLAAACGVERLTRPAVQHATAAPAELPTFVGGEPWLPLGARAPPVV